MIKLPRSSRQFPRQPGRAAEPGNAWASQWRFLPRPMRRLVNSAGHLRKLPQ